MGKKIFSIEEGEIPGGGPISNGTEILKYLPWNLFRGKRGVSHGYLILRNERGEMIQQLHNITFSNVQGRLGITPRNVPNYDLKLLFSEIREIWRSWRGYRDPVDLVITVIAGDETDPMLNFCRRDEVHHQVLFTGSEEEAVAKWRSALLAARDINKARHPYRSKGILMKSITCHSVIDSLMVAMDLDRKMLRKSPHIRRGASTMLTHKYHTPLLEGASLDALAHYAMEDYLPYLPEAHESYIRKARRADLKKELKGRAASQWRRHTDESANQNKDLWAGAEKAPQTFLPRHQAKKVY